jgi:hypothetical protein
MPGSGSKPPVSEVDALKKKLATQTVINGALQSENDELRQGVADIVRHVIGWHLTQEKRVDNSLARHMMAFDSREEGPKFVATS